MYEEQFQPELSPDLEALAPRFEALGLADIAARLRALSNPEPPRPSVDVPQLGGLLEQQLLSILNEIDDVSS